jgi:NTE family protein
VGAATFRDLDPPVIVNTVDVNSGMQVFWGLPGLDDVPVADAVFASCALPGYFPPQEIAGRYYVDGATVANLPIDATQALGGELIVAVDVSASSAFRADVEQEGFAATYARAAEIMMQSLQELRLRTWTVPPIYFIHPRVEHISLFSFDHLREEVEEGYRATIAALERPEEWPEAGAEGVFPKRRVIVRVERERCIGCGACLVHAAQGMFVLDGDRKAVVTQPEQEWSPTDGGYIRHCPTYAIIARPAPGQSSAALRRSG